ncbi:MAG: HAD family hydrolase [Luteolibacter sp.]
MGEGCRGLVLLDAAGTLIDLAEPVENVYARVFLQFGWEVPPEVIKAGFRETFASLADPDFSGHADGETAERAWWREVVARTARAGGVLSSGDDFERCFETLFHYYARGNAWRAFPEVKEVLEKLRVAGWKLVVVSNFDGRLRTVLSELGLAQQVDAILTSSDVMARKPSPKLLRAGMDLYPQAERVVHVGDSLKLDDGAAKAAGVPVFLVQRPEVDLRNLEEWLNFTFLQK